MQLYGHHHELFHISFKFDFFIGVDMAMCYVLICVKEIHNTLTFNIIFWTTIYIALMEQELPTR
jgi:hypothetical protein